MINPEALFNLLKKNNIGCFCGVPDSLLKDFISCIEDNTSKKEHIAAADEGSAVSIAAGHFLASGSPALVYMQNSGLGNCVNPLLSLIDDEVYNIPLLMFIGWRGEPGTIDEPQHIKQGKITDKLLDVMGIKYSIMPDNYEDTEPLIENAFKYMRETNCPYAFLIRKGIFEKYNPVNKKENSYTLLREDAAEIILKHLNEKDIIFSSTGYISREVYEIRNRLNQSHKQDFLTAGSMGYCSSIALGAALQKQDRNIYCFDGDGAFLMHQGAAAAAAARNLKNFKHIIFNNEAYDSTGAQRAVSNTVNFPDSALAAGYKKAYSVSDKNELIKILPQFIDDRCTSLLEIKVKCGARKDLGRPKEKPYENKTIFMENLNQITFCYRGAAENLSKIISLENAHKVLVFTGRKSYEKMKPAVEENLQGCEIVYYNNFSVNPKKEEIETALKVIKQDYDLIIAAGGGSVIDFAKGFRFYSGADAGLAAIPSTAGTGSESTQFSVIYENGIKKSLDDKSLMPEYALIDSSFAEDNPEYLKACTAMDAYCHAIESFWAAGASKQSREYARSAIVLCRDNIIKYVCTNDKKAAENMMLAANTAGRAINISRTSASHALSYNLTSLYGIPHGHACALTIAQLFEFNTKNGSFSELKELISDKPIEYFHKLFDALHLEYSFKKLGITDTAAAVQNVNQERLLNNPFKLNYADILEFFRE